MLSGLPAFARTIEVGPHRVLHLPSQAALVARDGDIVRIDPGHYADCAVWRANGLTIEAAKPDVVLRGKTCDGKGIFVTVGANITVRGLTFAGAAVEWHNGAGIRAEGANLTVERSRFLNNENGILAGGDSNSILRISDSEFIGNGACIGACAHGIYAGAAIFMLQVERCTFRRTRVGHHVKSRALTTIVRNSVLEDGPDGTASYSIDVPDGGNVLIEGNAMEKGPHSDNRETAISIGAEGAANPAGIVVVRRNTFRNAFPGRVAFVRNTSPARVVMTDNTLTGDVEPLR
jgi:hypothetical protein